MVTINSALSSHSAHRYAPRTAQQHFLLTTKKSSYPPILFSLSTHFPPSYFLNNVFFIRI
uniref:Uncharacterized protein n=1 Tax=Desertifilum tharense IPPAS B-1220 TaxID=1781255 RepID=A0ACD5GZD3_9CYAN